MKNYLLLLLLNFIVISGFSQSDTSVMQTASSIFRPKSEKDGKAITVYDELNVIQKIDNKINTKATKCEFYLFALLFTVLVFLKEGLIKFVRVIFKRVKVLIFPTF